MLADFGALAEVRQDGVRERGRGGGAGGGEPDLVGGGFDAEPRHIGLPLVEGTVVPELRFRAPEAGVAGLNRVTGPVVPADRAAGIVGRRPAAADFVEAVALLRVLVVEALDEQPRIVVGSAITRVVHPAGIEGLRPAERIELRQALEREQMN